MEAGRGEVREAPKARSHGSQAGRVGKQTAGSVAANLCEDGGGGRALLNGHSGPGLRLRVGAGRGSLQRIPWHAQEGADFRFMHAHIDIALHERLGTSAQQPGGQRELAAPVGLSRTCHRPAESAAAEAYLQGRRVPPPPVRRGRLRQAAR